MSGATSSRSSAIWSRSASRSSRRASARTSRPRRSSRRRSGCSTRWSARRSSAATRDAFRRKLRAGELDDKEIEIELPQSGSRHADVRTAQHARRLDRRDQHRRYFRQEIQRTKPKRMTRASRRTSRWSPRRPTSCSIRTQVVREAVAEVESNGIVFLDEIDKICAREGRGGADVSREGVQRDLLPLDRGHDRRDQARRGQDRPHPVRRLGRLPRRQALRPAAGTAGPPADPGRTRLADGGRFPAHPDRHRGEPDQAICGADADRRASSSTFTDDAIGAIARIAAKVNGSVENIGARRLQTVMERVLDEVSFTAADRAGEKVRIDARFRRAPYRRPRGTTRI